ncbi:conserved hypothetical protein [Bradyrhizobium sp. ORS 375]|uniref:hypothetical protein n=1 Tax=Bradyrhizobium sp. (strain ORS 375) TaxID=566679 RepID=UPI0002406FF7|nr:hypothetical protein [Bradyrhizobium sp. ORS 375]CCD96338.1 conserved hypothetical protein [Bradyrhizobium sp. ORS 375]
MTWKEERDALIAQTMAFVQSVTGKPADLSHFEPPAVPAGSAAAPPHATTLRGAPTGLPATAPIQSNPASRENGQAAERAAPADATLAAQPFALETPAAQAGPALPKRFTSIASQLDLQRDMQAEIRARVARFRAHQERFNRERQEYFSATLARLKASAQGTVLPED